MQLTIYKKRAKIVKFTVLAHFLCNEIMQSKLENWCRLNIIGIHQNEFINPFPDE
jgi:hypothetical protein